MEGAFAGKLMQDNKTGRILDADVSVENGDTFVFVPSGDPDRPLLAEQVPPPKKEVFLEFSRLRVNAANRRKRKPDASVNDLLTEELLSFAKEHGPLFGFAGLQDMFSDTAVIRESIVDWKAAQMVMEETLKAEVFSRGGDLDSEEIDRHFWIEVFDCPDQRSWEYVFDTGVVASDVYMTCLKDPFLQVDSTDDGTLHCSYWTDGRTNPDPDLSIENGHMSARFITRYPADVLRVPLFARSKRLPLSRVRGIGVFEEEVASLLKIVAGRHTGAISLDFQNFFSACASRDEGGYGIVCSSYLSYMWHELAQAYSRSSFRVCANPKCENIISVNEETSSGKRYCSPRCRAQANNKKLSEQNKRARKAFYALKTYVEIYEEAFEREMSFKDPERVKLCERLDGWIKTDFSKTAKGEAALKQGAARE